MAWNLIDPTHSTSSALTINQERTDISSLLNTALKGGLSTFKLIFQAQLLTGTHHKQITWENVLFLSGTLIIPSWWVAETECMWTLYILQLTVFKIVAHMILKKKKNIFFHCFIAKHPPNKNSSQNMTHFVWLTPMCFISCIITSFHWPT